MKLVLYIAVMSEQKEQEGAEHSDLGDAYNGDHRGGIALPTGRPQGVRIPQVFSPGSMSLKTSLEKIIVLYAKHSIPTYVFRLSS